MLTGPPLAAHSAPVVTRLMELMLTWTVFSITRCVVSYISDHSHHGLRPQTSSCLYLLFMGEEFIWSWTFMFLSIFFLGHTFYPAAHYLMKLTVWNTCMCIQCVKYSLTNGGWGVSFKQLLKPVGEGFKKIKCQTRNYAFTCPTCKTEICYLQLPLNQFKTWIRLRLRATAEQWSRKMWAPGW